MCDNSYPKTASWKEDEDCCTWDGVDCHQTTRHVIGLDLSCSWLRGPIHSNSTLFFLPHLMTLNLAGNCFNESLISPEFGKFKTLTHLNLSYSCFSGKIPNEISHLSSLVSLDLSLNDELLIETPVWKRVIHNLTQLRELLLDWSDMSSIRPNSLMNLSSSFTTLSLHECNLQGKLQNNFLCLPSIQTLDLGFNDNLDLGSLPKCNRSSIFLKFLDLSSISFSGKLPDFIDNMKSLEHLNLANCNLTGSISTSFGNLTKLTILDLSSNSFSGEGEVPDFIDNMKSLEHLNLANCNLIGSISTSLGNLTKLTILDLSYNSFSGLLPLSLYNLPNLSSLYLDNNQLVGPLPNHVSGLLNLKDLYLSSNFLNGTLPSWLFNLPSLVTLSLYGNQFIGEIGEFQSNSLEHLDLGYNKLYGPIPRSISRFVNLTYLSLSSNNWSIMLELEMFSKLKNLEFLDFSNNLVSINNNVTYTLPKLRSLNLSSCNISEFPIFLRIATTLQFLDLSKNRIYGQVPKWLGDMGRDSLYFLDLHDNLLQGPFLTLSFLSLEYLSISNNKLTGGIPSLICNASSLYVLDLSHNNLSGVVPKCLVHSNVLSVLNLRMNSLYGTIPTTFSTVNKFRNINLNGNQLEGPLPRSLANCRNLEVLDLGSNKINGTFPNWLEGLLNLQEKLQ
nr:receptor-like protein Cf-9 homolog [Quercus suber]